MEDLILKLDRFTGEAALGSQTNIFYDIMPQKMPNRMQFCLLYLPEDKWFRKDDHLRDTGISTVVLKPEKEKISVILVYDHNKLRHLFLE